MTVPQSIASELQKLEPSAEIELFEIDATAIGADIYRMHPGKNGLIGDIVWQGNTYTAFPIKATGFDLNGRGQLPRPKLTVSNVLGTMSALVIQYGDLAGCKVTRIRTLAKYLDAVNFPSRRNLLTYTEDLSTYWSGGGTLVTVNTAMTPYGDMNADKLIASAATAGHSREYYKVGIMTAGQPYTFAAFVKAAELSRFRFWFHPSGSGAQFDLKTGKVLSLNGTTSATITPIGDQGWYRCTNTYTPPSQGDALRIYLLDSTLADSWTGDGASGIYAWGFQLDAGDATDYQPVTGSTWSQNATADPTAEFPRDVFFIDRKSGENREAIEFELAAALDLVGVRVPHRQIIQNYCPVKYRGSECGYAGTSYFDTNDTPVSSAAQDVCGKRLTSCRLRFGANAELPYGGFPAAGLIKQ